MQDEKKLEAFIALTWPEKLASINRMIEDKKLKDSSKVKKKND